MIRYWQQDGQQFVKMKKDEIDPERRLWVDARNVSQEEAQLLQREYGLDPELLADVMDPDELSRIEAWDGYVLTIMRLPVFSPGADPAYTTAPLGAVIFPDKIITICWTDCEVLRDICANRIKDISLGDFPAFIIRILARSDMMFLRYLKEINRRTNSIQNELHEQIENSELIQLLGIEKSLTFFTTSLRANQLFLEKIRRTRILSLDDEDKDWLDDVEIDNRQAMQMADTYSSIVGGIMEAFASVISNNMNVIMKKLTVISLVLMVASFITSFWGMNIRLPFSMSETWHGFFFLTGLCVFAAAAAYFVMNHNPIRKIRRARKK